MGKPQSITTAPRDGSYVVLHLEDVLGQFESDHPYRWAGDVWRDPRGRPLHAAYRAVAWTPWGRKKTRKQDLQAWMEAAGV